MQKYGFFGCLLLLIFASCLDPELPHINGMWQLKTITDSNNQISSVDTIYYSFQRQAIFSYTIINNNSDAPQTTIIYGYIDFPDDDKLHILLDKSYQNKYDKLLLWKGIETAYDIVKLNSKDMILKQDDKTYHFIKF
jgi:hypothetical protein